MYFFILLDNLLKRTFPLDYYHIVIILHICRNQHHSFIHTRLFVNYLFFPLVIVLDRSILLHFGIIKQPYSYLSYHIHCKIHHLVYYFICIDNLFFLQNFITFILLQPRNLYHICLHITYMLYLIL